MAEYNIIVRNEHKTQIAAFNAETRRAIDEAIVAINDFSKKNAKDAAYMMRRQAIATYLMASDEEAITKAGFDTFKDAAAALVNLKPSNATQYRKAGEFILSKDAPKVVQWYSPSTLYLFTSKKIPVETINHGIEAGELTEEMPATAVIAWIEAHNPKALEDGEESVKVLPKFDAHITIHVPSARQPYAFTGTLDEIKAELVKAITAGDVIVDNDRYGTYNPHSVLKRGDKEVNGKAVFLAYGGSVATAVYFPVEKSKGGKGGKKSATAATVEAQNKTIEALMAEIEALKAKLG